MPYARKTLSQAQDDLLSDLDASFTAAQGRLRFDVPGFLAVGLAGGATGMYGYLDWIARQSNPFTATDEFLEAWAALKNVFRKAATAAAGTVRLVATAAVPSGTMFTRGDGVGFVSSADAAAGGGHVDVPVRSVLPGAAGNTDIGATFNLNSAIAGVAASGSNLAAIAGGADVEKDDPLRVRMLQAYAAPSRGGNLTDFAVWTLAVPGVTRAWPVRNGMGIGTTVTYFMMDEVRAVYDGYPQGTNGVSAFEDRDPTTATGDQLTVADALFDIVPANPINYLVAPAKNVVVLTISGIADVTVRARVELAIAAILTLSGDPRGGKVNLSRIEAAIAAITGTDGFVITTISCSHGSVTPGANGNIISNTGYLPAWSASTWL